jgi:hypothetical protein
MSSHAEKTRDAILGAEAPRDIEWTRFVQMWEDTADRVEDETGDRLAVNLHGHREVFHREHSGIVGIEDIERARHLLRSTPPQQDTEVAGSVAGHLLVVAVDNRTTRIIDFDLNSAKTRSTSRELESGDPNADHLRTVERQTGRDDEHDQVGYFTAIGKELTAHFGGREFVVLGHGRGKANTAEQFVARMKSHDKTVHARIVAVGQADLSAASDTDLLREARRLAG